MGEAKICDVGETGIILPLLGDTEQKWPNGLRTVLYLLGLLWCFMGVALIAEKFMEAIERVTSSTYRKKLENGRTVTITLWNETVANLTLMALGSSAPEILLSVIELIFMNNFFAGALGPSTIVGSAAFNLFVISAVCIYVVPDGEYRKIKEVPVYIITAIFSVFAYIWLLIILIASSPDVVTIGEAVVTFLFFPVLVIIAFVADKGYLTPGGAEEKGELEIRRGSMSKEDIAEMNQHIKELERQGASAEQIEKIICANFLPRTSRATRRVQATRAITAGKRIEIAGVKDAQEAMGQKNMNACQQDSNKVAPFEETQAAEEHPNACKLEFECSVKAVLEHAGHVELVVNRTGNLEGTATVKYATRDGTAVTGNDYKQADGLLTFAPGVKQQAIKIEIIDNDVYQDDCQFCAVLSEPTNTAGPGQLGSLAESTVTILDNDFPGEFAFPADTLPVIQTDEDQEVKVIVERRGGAVGEVSVHYATEDGSALQDRDYEPVEGDLVFEKGIVSRHIPVVVKGRGRYESNESFKIRLTQASGGAKFHKNSDGGEDCCLLTVDIEVNLEDKKKIDRIFGVARVNWDRTLTGHSNWKDQFKDAVFVNGGDDGVVSPLEWVTHILLFPWKLLFALVPPTDFCGGWVCFFSSLAMIGGVTLLVGEMAALLGCVMNLDAEITAITLVALGTSLPDTFASMEAAAKDPYADASIVNVTGSNSVNVFLGLGLPLTIAAFYWSSMGQTDEWLERYENTRFITDCPEGCFVMEAGGLAFSVGVFSACAILALLALAIRRHLYEGELGGPKIPKILSSVFFASLWGVYIVASIVYIIYAK